MKPYYEDDAVTIYHGDCREIVPAVSADVLITDPPYGIDLSATSENGYRGPNNRTKRAQRSVTPYRDEPEIVREMIRSTVPMLLGQVSRGLIFCGPAMLFAYPEPRSIGSVFTPAGAGRGPWGFQCSHPILYYGTDPYLSDGRGGRPNAFRDEQPNREDFAHPCPKPLKWMRWAIDRASRPGETVLDPFMGSGTTLRAAKDLGRKAIGVEIEERYCEIAAQRMGQEVLDLAA
jgi:site-specific DNA-methyltransferase (adenine-specific)